VSECRGAWPWSDRCCVNDLAILWRALVQFTVRGSPPYSLIPGAVLGRGHGLQSEVCSPRLPSPQWMFWTPGNGWIVSDYMLVLCQKLHICTYDRRKIFRSPHPPPSETPASSLAPPKVEVLTAPAWYMVNDRQLDERARCMAIARIVQSSCWSVLGRRLLSALCGRRLVVVRTV